MATKAVWGPLIGMRTSLQHDCTPRKRRRRSGVDLSPSPRHTTYAASTSLTLTRVEAEEQWTRKLAIQASRSASPAYSSLSSNHFRVSRNKCLSFVHVEVLTITSGLGTGLTVLPRHSHRSSSGAGTTSGFGKNTFAKGRRAGRETLWWGAKRPLSDTSVKQSEGYDSLDGGDEGDAAGHGFDDDLGGEGSVGSGGPDTFLSLAEAGLVELAALEMHEKFLARLTISSLNLLRKISQQEGVPIEELNAGKIVDWFTKDKVKREDGSDSAVLKW
eukprot:TRINITY_DN2669_c0_g1_i1.p1 TRINITY_DN2669_c0_g1~~TRINITY_DN2669_c0_g1_i1.p1  ORF type:complete len:273 (-),score=42.29 TRINITY_DN2669_c0_g1_i1:114-932(-)